MADGENLILIEKLLTEARENLDRALKFLQKNTKNPAVELIETAAKNCSEAIELSRMGRLKFKPADAFRNSERIEEFRKLLQEKGFGKNSDQKQHRNPAKDRKDETAGHSRLCCGTLSRVNALTRPDWRRFQLHRCISQREGSESLNWSE